MKNSKVNKKPFFRRALFWAGGLIGSVFTLMMGVGCSHKSKPVYYGPNPNYSDERPIVQDDNNTQPVDTPSTDAVPQKKADKN